MANITTLPLCPVEKDDDAMYGVGIRVGFYLQYFVFIWAAMFFGNNKDERAGAALALWLFKFGTMAALVNKIISDADFLPVEIYIILLLLIRIPILRIPALIFDFCVPLPTLERDDVSDSVASWALLTIDFIIAMWFWAKGINASASADCTQWGFLFEKVDLKAHWFITLNIVCLVIFYALAICQAIRRVYQWIRQAFQRIRRVKPKRNENEEKLRKQELRLVVHRSTVAGFDG
jgi:hypothetical protein